MPFLCWWHWTALQEISLFWISQSFRIFFLTLDRLAGSGLKERFDWFFFLASRQEIPMQRFTCLWTRKQKEICKPMGRANAKNCSCAALVSFSDMTAPCSSHQKAAEHRCQHEQITPAWLTRVVTRIRQMHISKSFSTSSSLMSFSVHLVSGCTGLFCLLAILKCK